MMRNFISQMFQKITFYFLDKSSGIQYMIHQHYSSVMFIAFGITLPKISPALQLRTPTTNMSILMSSYELQSPYCSSGTRKKLTKFLSSANSPPDHGNSSLASETPSEHRVVQFLSSIEKSRPVLRDPYKSPFLRLWIDS